MSRTNRKLTTWGLMQLFASKHRSDAAGFYLVRERAICGELGVGRAGRCFAALLRQDGPIETVPVKRLFRAFTRARADAGAPAHTESAR